MRADEDEYKEINYTELSCDHLHNGQQNSLESEVRKYEKNKSKVVFFCKMMYHLFVFLQRKGYCHIIMDVKIL